MGPSMSSRRRRPQRLTAERARREIGLALGLTAHEAPRNGDELRALIADAIEEHARRDGLDVGKGYGRTTLGLLYIALRHDVPSLPGDSIRCTPGRRRARAISPGAPAEGSREQLYSVLRAHAATRAPVVDEPRKRAPSYRLAATMLRALHDGLRAQGMVAALFLLHEGLDTSPCFVTSRAAPPPKGGARVVWLSRKIRDLVRESRAAEK